MALYKRKNSKNYFIQFQLDGKTYIKSTGTSNKQLAERIEAKYRLEVLEQKELGVRESITLEEACNKYLLTKKERRNRKTLQGHIKHIKNYINCTKQFHTITNRDVNDMYLSLMENYKPSYIKTIFVTFSSIVKQIDDLEYKVPKLKFPKIAIKNEKLRYLTKDEETQLLENLNPEKRDFVGAESEAIEDAHDIVVLLLDTGCRYGEVIRLEWSDIDFNNRTISIYRPKVDNESILHMTDRVYDVLMKRFNEKDTPWIFPADDKTSARKYPSWAIRNAMNKSGLQDCTVHTLRHTFASRLVQRGVSLYQVSKLLGHSTTKTTQRYAHLEMNNASKNAVDILNGMNQI